MIKIKGGVMNNIISLFYFECGDLDRYEILMCFDC